MDVKWRSDRIDSGGMKTTLIAKAPEITAEDVSALGDPLGDYLSGSYSAELDATIEPGGVFESSVVADLRNSGLSIAAANWSKDVGVDGEMSASLSIGDEGMISVRDFRMDAGTLSLSGKAGFDPEGDLLTIDLESAGIGNSLLSDLSLSRSPELGTRIAVGGGSLDLVPLLARYGGQQQDGDKSGSDDAVAEVTENNTDTDAGALQIDIARLDKVVFSPERHLQDVSIALSTRDGAWHSIQVGGRDPFVEQAAARTRSGQATEALKPGEFSFHFGPQSDEGYPLAIEVENLGGLLATTLDNHALTGGYLEIQGKSSEALMNAPVDATLMLKKFTVVNVPVVAQILNFGSLSQPLKTLRSEGLAFESFFGDLQLHENIMSTDLLRANGGSLGMTIEGSIDLAARTIDLEGGVIPLYKIGNVVGKIPLLKHVVVGDDGKGIIALDYKVTGPFDEPEVSVNPGTLLTPGALRHIFDTAEPEQENPD
jgi:hypothetical protein